MDDKDKKDDKPQQQRGGWGMIAFGWLMAVIVVSVLFNGVLQNRNNPNRLSSLQEQSGALVLQANHLGQYLAEGRINGTAVTFLLDTGATTVAVPASIASLAGLNNEDQIVIETAAGKAVANNTRIRRLSLGPLLFSDLRAIVLPAESGDTVLLGMNALADLKITQEDGELVLEKLAN
ncbi:MAG: retropepsin-like aspartic protease family protein [Gammaproteobacteria bacterium WSBS_2016_MAG_OTU1]